MNYMLIIISDLWNILWIHSVISRQQFTLIKGDLLKDIVVFGQLKIIWFCLKKWKKEKNIYNNIKNIIEKEHDISKLSACFGDDSTIGPHKI